MKKLAGTTLLLAGLLFAFYLYRNSPFRYFPESWLSNNTIISYLINTNPWGQREYRIEALHILERRNAFPLPALTNYYKKKILTQDETWDGTPIGLYDGYRRITYELEVYWDDQLFPVLLNHNFEGKYNILSSHADNWKSISNSDEQVYDAIVKDLKPTTGDGEELDPYWMLFIEVGRISRDPRLLDYQQSLLTNKTVLNVNDLCEIHSLSALPEDYEYPIQKIRVCDIAFLELLRYATFLSSEREHISIDVNNFIHQSIDKWELRLLDDIQTDKRGLACRSNRSRRQGLSDADYLKQVLDSYVKMKNNIPSGIMSFGSMVDFYSYPMYEDFMAAEIQKLVDIK